MSSRTNLSRRQFLKSAIFGLGAAAVPGLTACGAAVAPAPTSQSAAGGQEPQRPAAAQAVDVTILTGGWPFGKMPDAEDLAQKPSARAYKQVLEAWLADNPGVKIERVEVDIWNQQKLLAALAAGTAPSIFPGLVLGGYNRAATQAAFAQGLAADVTDLVAKHGISDKVAEYARPMWRTWEQEGRFYGAPENYNAGLGIYYRRDFLEEAGVEEPKAGWTWADFRRMARELTTGERKGAALQKWGISWSVDRMGFSSLTQLPAPQTGWNWAADYTTLAPEFKAAIENYREMVYGDKSVLTDSAFGDEEVAKAFRNGEVAMISNNTGYLTKNPDEETSMAGLARELGRPLDEVVGWIQHPVGATGMFGSTQPQVVLAAFSPDLSPEALEKTFSFFEYVTYGEGFKARRKALYDDTQDVQRVFSDATPINGITSFEGVPGDFAAAWSAKFRDAVLAAANLPLVPDRGLFIPAEKNVGPTNDAVNDAYSSWSFEAGERDILADLKRLEQTVNEQLAGFSSSVDDAAFVEGARAYYQALDAFWKEHAPEFHAQQFGKVYESKILPALA